MRSKDYLILRTYTNDQVGDFVDEHQHNIQEFDPQLVRRLVEKITIFQRYMEFTFKDGEVIRVNIWNLWCTALSYFGWVLF